MKIDIKRRVLGGVGEGVVCQGDAQGREKKGQGGKGQ